MKKAIAIIILSLLLSSNAYAGYKVQLKDKNKYGTVFRISSPLVFDNAGKWDKAFQKTIDIANKHCKTFNKKTFTFWSERKGAYARDANGRLIPKYLADHDGWGIIQDLEPMFKVKVRYFCAENIDKAYETLKNYSKYFEYPFSSTIFSGTIKYSETSKDPFKFKNLVKAVEKKKPKPKKKKPPTKVGIPEDYCLRNGEWVPCVAEKPKKKKPKKQIKDGEVYAVASGTGFFINDSGNIISNNHVIDACNTVKVHYEGVATPVIILATDRVNDLSLMKSKVSPKDYFSVSEKDAVLLDEIYVAGYPFGKMVSSSVKVTKGVVSALTGIANNYSNIQIDAALQPGNSGGPIINNKGNAVGVAVAKLDYKAIIKDFGAIPEGTNFGIKSSTVRQFISGNNVSSPTGGHREMSTQDIGKKIQMATVYLDCWMTAQQIKQYKTRKTFFTNIE